MPVEKGYTIFNHANRVYTAMHETAVPQEDGSLLWEGFLTKLYSDLELSVPYYSRVNKLLMKMGCIAQERRGGGGAPSLWRLFHAPTEELFDQVPEKDKLTYSPEGGQRERVRDQRERDLLKYIQNLDARLANVEAVVLEAKE